MPSWNVAWRKWVAIKESDTMNLKTGNYWSNGKSAGGKKNTHTQNSLRDPVEWLVLRHRIQEVPGSTLSPETGNPHSDFRGFSQSLQSLPCLLFPIHHSPIVTISSGLLAASLNRPLSGLSQWSVSGTIQALAHFEREQIRSGRRTYTPATLLQPMTSFNTSASLRKMEVLQLLTH